MDKRTIKIFISSPGDVLYERQIAKRVISKLGKDLASSVKLEALLWEDMPLQVTTSFQEGIDQIANANIVDIAVFILWSRLGSPLAKTFTKSNGSYYKSGTEYEFDMMYAANQKSGTPSILAYIKNAPITEAISKFTQTIDFEEIGKQQKEAQRFIREKFYDPETKTTYGAYHMFEESTSFEQKLTEHLRFLIIKEIGHEVLPVEWEGNPYVGLRSFSYEENAIFYGRRHTINKIEEELSHFLPDKTPSLFILGESGSGKSSLVRAGLLPDIIEFGWIENAKWKWFDLMPNQFRGDVYNGISAKLVEAFPILKEKSIGNDLISGKEINFDHLSDILPDNKSESVLLFIDQFEEIFTDPLITEEERVKTFHLLNGIASIKKVWLILTMRNDFYHKFISYPVLSELRNKSIIYDLPKILHSELQEIVDEPAKKAGLKWEINDRGTPLNKTIIHDINSGIDDLPLVEFALSELYNLRGEDNVLTYKAYEEIGKIDGAVVKYVDNFYNTLSEDEKVIFYRILSALITPSIESKDSYVRKTALLNDLQKSEQHKHLIDRLIDKHILVSGKDATGNATVFIVHEILISSWQVIQNWVKQEKGLIETNNHYENLAKYWVDHGKSKNDLLNKKKTIKESEYFLFEWEGNCSKNVLDFLYSSIKKRIRKDLPLAIFALLLVIANALSSFLESNEFFKIVTITSALALENKVLMNIMLLLIFTYSVWKKIKAAPVFYTINVSLIVWSAFLIMSIIYSYLSITQKISNNVDVDSWDYIDYLVLPVISLIKLTLAIFKKRKFSKRKFSSNESGFKRPGAIFNWKIKITPTRIVLLLIVGIIIAGMWFSIHDKQKKIDESNKKIDDIYNHIEAASSDIPSDLRIYIYKSRLDYLTNTKGYIGKMVLDELSNDFFDKSYFNDSIDILNYQYALCQYYLGDPGYDPDLVISSPYLPAQKLAINITFELGMLDDCRKLLKKYKESLKNTEGLSLDYFDENLIWTAEKVSSFELVKEIYNESESIDNNKALAVYKAHALLMTGEREKALALYREQLSDNPSGLKNNLIRDFSVFRWLRFPDNEISEVERELNLDRIQINTSPKNDNNTANLAKQLTGNWKCEENGYIINWEISSNNYNLGCYLIQTTDKKTGEIYDYDITVARHRLKQVDSVIIIEEYDARNNTLLTGEIVKINEDEMQLKITGSTNPELQNKVRIYIRKPE